MMASGLVIRDAREDDRGAVRALTLAAYAEYASVMAPDVRRAFAAIHREKTGGDDRAAEAWLGDLAARGRYLVDVWAAS